MSIYNRKGGSGKSGTLRQQFNYYKRQLENRLIEEYAGQRARGIAPAGIPKTLFKRLDYKSLFEEGVTRKVGGKTIRFTGEKAIQVQIESLKARASKSYQAEAYINNYLQSLTQVGFSQENLSKVDNALHKLSVDKLTYLINNNILPEIYFVYSEEQDEDELTDDILYACKYGVTGPDFKAYKERKKELTQLYKTEFRVLGYLG